MSFAAAPILNGQLVDTTPQPPPVPPTLEPVVTNEVIADSPLTSVTQSSPLTSEVLLSIEQSTSVQPLDPTSLAESFDNSYGGEYDSAQLLATYGYVPSPDGEIALLLSESQFYYAYDDSAESAAGSNAASQADPSGELAQGASPDTNQAPAAEEEREEEREEAARLSQTTTSKTDPTASAQSTTSSPSPSPSPSPTPPPASSTSSFNTSRQLAVTSIPLRAIDQQAFPLLDAAFSSVSPAEAEAQFATAEKTSMTETADKLGLVTDPNAQPPTPAQIQTLLNNVIQMIRGTKQSLNR